jgi:hypothetical protein
VSIELSYTSHRVEVWRWYWKTWRRKLWVVHLALAVAICYVAIQSRRTEPIEVAVAKGALMSALAIVGLIAYPQLMFKPQVRTLAVDESGVSTKVGRRSGRRAWREISSIVDDGGYIVMATRKGAFIVPPRAFRSDIERSEFLRFVTGAKAASSSGAR